ncbi:MAG: hypothetical protein NT070_12910 [Cyanobacteria bacterium]|nr:hypothetical protein [Cyanobacteriota bacterium]
MNTTATLPHPSTRSISREPIPLTFDTEKLTVLLESELTEALAIKPTATTYGLSARIAVEVERICEKSDRIQKSGEVTSWRLNLSRYRMDKCIQYYRLGSRRGRVELHSILSSMVYRSIAPAHLQLGFQGRYTLIEDFLQGFYTESLRVLRRENQLAEDYQPKTKLQLAEYMAFTEQYAKRRINLPGRNSQQLVILRASSFSSRQPNEIVVDIETAMDSAKDGESDAYGRSPVMQMIREKMVSDDNSNDPEDGGLRDRIINELVSYLKSQNQQRCIDYLSLKLQDLSVAEIDDILGLTSRERDYLQQRFKYHIEKFAMNHNWELVHEWLGANLNHNLGMSPQLWSSFCADLTPDLRQLLDLKRNNTSDRDIATAIGCTPKQVHKRWSKLLQAAWEARNQAKG